MAETIKILGQRVPAATNTLYDLYTGVGNVVISSLTVCSQQADGTFRLAVCPQGAATDPKHYIYYNIPLKSGNSFTAQLGITLQNSDIIRINASNTGFSFGLFGTEISA